MTEVLEVAVSNIMELKVKDVKIYEDLSEETMCYTATLMLDGKPVATCRNDGRGGATDVYFEDWSIRCKVADFCKEHPITAVLPNKKSYSFDTIDALVDELVLNKRLYEENKSCMTKIEILKKAACCYNDIQKLLDSIESEIIKYIKSNGMIDFSVAEGRCHTTLRKWEGTCETYLLAVKFEKGELVVVDEYGKNYTRSHFTLDTLIDICYSTELW